MADKDKVNVLLDIPDEDEAGTGDAPSPIPPKRKRRKPNAKTVAAMKESRRGGLASFRNVDELIKDLGEK